MNLINAFQPTSNFGFTCVSYFNVKYNYLYLLEQTNFANEEIEKKIKNKNNMEYHISK